MTAAAIERAAALCGSASHPLRIRVMLAAGAADRVGPKDLAAELGESLPLVSYHVRELADAGLLEEAGLEPRRGAVAHFYRPTDDGRKVLAAVEAMA